MQQGCAHGMRIHIVMTKPADKFVRHTSYLSAQLAYAGPSQAPYFNRCTTSFYRERAK